MQDTREARRKRLVERKTGRLAFITGQNRNLAQSAPQDAASPEDKDNIATETPKNYHGDGIVSDTLDNSSEQDPTLKPGTGLLHMFETESENPQLEADYVSRAAQKNELNRTGRGEDISGQLFAATNEAAQTAIFTIFTLKNISHSVLTTENIRLLFAFVVAILAVSSYNGFLIGGRLVSSIISFRPLLLVLFTDVTIILGWVFLNQGISQKPEEDARKKATMQEDQGWPNDLSKVLEIGQLLQKVLAAALMDCSICAIFMICGNIG